MRRKPIIIQVAGHQYLSDSQYQGKNVLCQKLDKELREKHNFVKLIDLFDLNENYASSLKLHNLYSHIYKNNCNTIELFNEIIELMYSHIQLKMMGGRVDKIIIIHNSIYDLVLDLTMKYMLNFTSLFDNELQIASVLKTYMNPEVNPFLIKFKRNLEMFPIDILLFYHDSTSTPKPRGEYTSEIMQDVYDKLHSYSILQYYTDREKLQYYLCEEYMDISKMDLSSDSMPDMIDEVIEEVILKVDAILLGGN